MQKCYSCELTFVVEDLDKDGQCPECAKYWRDHERKLNSLENDNWWIRDK